MTEENAGAAVVVLGAGSGSRSGARVNKVLLPLAGVPVLARSVVDALDTPGVVRVVVVVRDGETATVSDALAPHLADDRTVDLVVGGADRHASEERALAVLADDVADGRVDVVAIHDGARPLAGADLLSRVLDAARAHGGAVPVVPAPALVSRDGAPVATGLVAMQTPQAFRARDLLAAYEAAAARGHRATDTAGTVAAHGAEDVAVVAVPGDPANLKITWPGDLDVASRLV
ncbi:2-C-methyl-D-erythritol 4-phosphate cytidylyltransferase [Nocardioides sp. CFH 31398]|uniref:IspD/TarI family cytidylyltransferase n=1 Tax=Nocardioides sp. CFH 31398 TaxID=2919579 RepID=UPI001F051D6C|nr:2-C-methyl-D-erythritol 4-phosphate cytidylyltransferase [Nocardioides sp. CFH 31398]MCH1865933.1 2-C-methyl-D-erythritol 4-phosphate cytidylyltransferase [Nocardioides sp. CFH 31398]